MVRRARRALRYWRRASLPPPLSQYRAPCARSAVACVRSRSPVSLRALWFAVLKQTLEGSGALGQVRAKIRAEIFKALEEVRVAASQRLQRR